MAICWIAERTSSRDPQSELRVRLRDLVSTPIRYGYRRLTARLRREGWPVNTKRVYRLYREEGLGGADEEAVQESGPDANPGWRKRTIRINDRAWTLEVTGWWTGDGFAF